MGVWVQIDMMPNSDDLSQAPVLHACELRQEAHDVFPYGFFLTAGVDIFPSVFRVRVGLLRAVRGRTVESSGSPSAVVKLG